MSVDAPQCEIAYKFQVEKPSSDEVGSKESSTNEVTVKDDETSQREG